MVEIMNEVMARLAEIEAAAMGIMENTNARKLQIAKEAEERMAECDKELQSQLDSKIADMKQEHDKEIQCEIQHMKEESEKIIQDLEEEYQNSHQRIAQGIVNILTGV